MVLLKRILILEDNLQILSKFLAMIAKIEEDQPFDLSVMVLTDYEMVEQYINIHSHMDFDIILLDRDDKLNRSFHIANIERLGVKKIIGISSVPEYNMQLRQKGVTKIIEKNFGNIDKFVSEVDKTMRKMLQKMPLISRT